MKPLIERKEISADCPDFADYRSEPRPGLRDKESPTLTIDVFISPTHTNRKSKSM